MLPDEEKMKSLTKLCVLFPWEYTKDVELCQYGENAPKGRGRGHGHINPPSSPVDRWEWCFLSCGLALGKRLRKKL